MEVEVPVLRNAPHDGSNLMKTENAVQDLPLINEEEEFDLLKVIYSKDMEELDKNEGEKRKIKKPTSCPIFGWPFHGRNYRTKPVVDILEQHKCLCQYKRRCNVIFERKVRYSYST